MPTYTNKPKLQIIPVITGYLIICTFFLQIGLACDQNFEGFGIFLGSNEHFRQSKPGTEAKVLEVIYDFVGLRHFRTSFEQEFSPEPDKYEINCPDDERTFTCSWIEVHEYIGNLTDAKVFASVWSPPHYMKNGFYQLLPEYETAYLHFLRNMTMIMKQNYNITIEKVSPVNEPENLFAPWDHTNMTPEQLCRFVRTSNEPLISICPENSYFWISKIYYNFESTDDAQTPYNCSQYCDVMATHAYTLNLDFSSENSMLAYYDMKAYDDRGTNAPIWMTEVSSTYKSADQNQMTEALDLASNIINYVGTTCIQRYYFWYAYTLGYSGESLIWGDDNGNLIFPKKFFTYKLFVDASNTINGSVVANACSNISNSFMKNGHGMQSTPRIVQNLECIQFGDKDRVLVNREVEGRQLNDLECSSLCCTTETDDITCETFSNHSTVQIVPARAICHCVLTVPVTLHNSIVL